MSALLEPKMQSSANVADMSAKLAFSKKIQVVTNRIHSTANVDEIILDVSRDICQLFEADRMTVYITSEDGGSIVSKVKTGLNSFKDIKLPISESSLAGFCALNKRHMNIKDVYDDAELKQYSPNLTFLKAVDQRTGYRSKQMLIAPILGGDIGHRPDGRAAADQQPRRASRSPRCTTRAWSSCPRRSPSPSACASRCRARSSRSSSTW